MQQGAEDGRREAQDSQLEALDIPSERKDGQPQGLAVRHKASDGEAVRRV